MTRWLRSTELPIDHKRACAKPTSAPSASIDHTICCLSLAVSVRRSFHVAGIAGSCHTECACRARMSAAQRSYASRSASTGMRSVVVFPRIVPPSAMALGVYELAGGRETDGELGATAIEVLRADVPAVSLGDGLRDGEPQTRAIAYRVLAAIEALEETDLRTFP